MRDNGLIERLNEESDGRYSYLKLKSIDVKQAVVAGDSLLCVVTYLYPESMETVSDGDREAVAEITRRLLELKGKPEILFKKSHIDAEFISADVYRFLSESPAIGFLLDKNDIVVTAAGGAVDIEVRLFDSVHDYAVKANIKQKLYERLDADYCAEFKINLAKKQGEITAAPKDDGNIYRAFGAKAVKITEVERFIGKEITDTPRRISDVKSAGNDVTVCGSIKFINKYDIKKGKNPEGRHVFNYTIDDGYGKIKVFYFSKPDTDARADTLIQGTKIAVRGNVEKDDYNGMSRLVMFAYDISLCEIPPQSAEKIVKVAPPKNYKKVFPVKVTNLAQDDFLTEMPPLNSLLEKNAFVVFDVETTGINATDKIIEISACRVEGGVITEHFSTLVNPETLIPAAATKVNLITNQMVADAPRIEEVIGDFYKFCENCAIVAYNIEFDHGFVTRAGADFGYVFDHKQYDAYALARQYIQGLSNYALSSVCRFYGIVNETAHRALSDSIATAKAFIKLTDKITENK